MEDFPFINSQEYRARVAKMVTNLFDHWGIHPKDQATLLDLPDGDNETLARYRAGAFFGPNSNVLRRTGELLAVHKALRVIFPYDRDLVYEWVKAPNKSFNGKTPLEVMLGDFEGLRSVRKYLERELGR